MHEFISLIVATSSKVSFVNLEWWLVSLTLAIVVKLLMPTDHDFHVRFECFHSGFYIQNKLPSDKHFGRNRLFNAHLYGNLVNFGNYILKSLVIFCLLLNVLAVATTEVDYGFFILFLDLQWPSTEKWKRVWVPSAIWGKMADKVYLWRSFERN